GLLRFLHGTEEGLRGHHKKCVDAGANEKKGEILHASGTEAGPDGTGQEIESCKLRDQTECGDRKAGAVADRGQQVASQDSVEFPESGVHETLPVRCIIPAASSTSPVMRK